MTMPNTMRTAEKAVYKRTNKMLAGATRRYKKLMRQATKAANQHKREQYLAAALGALVITGVVASKIKASLDSKKAPTVLPAKRRKRRKAVPSVRRR